MPTTSAVPSADPSDLLFNAQKLDEVVNGVGDTFTDRRGVERLTLTGAMKLIGFEPPVSFVSGLSITRATQTVSYSGDNYHAAPEALPFTTTSTFSPAQWRLLSSVTMADIVGYAVPLVGGAGTIEMAKLAAAVQALINGAAQKSGATMTGPMNLWGNADAALQAVPRQQAETIADAAAEATRGTDTRIAQLPESSMYDNNYSSMLVKTNDGRVVGWGRATTGNLGTGHTHDGEIRAAFANFAPLIPSGVTIAGFQIGSADSFVWLSNGWVYHAGNNARGIGGHGDTTRRVMFTRIQFFVTGGLSVVDVKPRCHRADDQYSCALFRCSNGDVYFAGYTGDGDAGDGVAFGARNVSTPVKCLTVAGAVGISSGSDNHSGNFAWRADGTCYAWGNNFQGSLGIGTTSAISTPVALASMQVAKVVSRTSMNSSNARLAATLFLMQDGTVRAAGINGSGTLGDGTTTDRSTPVNVGSLSGVVDIGLGGGDWGWGWAVTSAKQLWLWGYNGHGGLGVGDTANRTTPVQPIGWIDEADTEVTTGSAPFQGKVVKVVTGKTVAAGPLGRQQTIVLDEDGNVWSAGYNDTQAVGWNDAGLTYRFKRAALQGVPPGDKIIDIITQGHSTNGMRMRLFALTEQGRVLMSGSNSYTLGTCLPGTAYHGNVFLQPVRLGV